MPLLLRSTLKLCTKCQIWGTLPAQERGDIHNKDMYLLLMKCFITFLTYVKMMERAFDSIYEPLMVHNVLFLPMINLKFHTNLSFHVPSHQKECDAVLQGDTSIAA